MLTTGFLADVVALFVFEITVFAGENRPVLWWIFRSGAGWNALNYGVVIRLKEVAH